MASITRTLAASAARTTTGTGGTEGGFGDATMFRAQLNVTAASGTAPNLVVLIEDTLDGGTTWNPLLTFAAATGVTRQVMNLTTPFSDDLRASWTITGTTPSFTFSVVAVAQ